MTAPRQVLGSGFFYTLIGGFLLAFFTLGIIGIGECARDGSAQALSCQTAHARIGLFYPLFYLAVTGLAIVRHRRGKEFASGLAVFAGPLAAAAVMLLNAFAK